MVFLAPLPQLSVQQGLFSKPFNTTTSILTLSHSLVTLSLLQITYNIIKVLNELSALTNMFRFNLNIFVKIILPNRRDIHTTNNILDLEFFINVGRYFVQL